MPCCNHQLPGSCACSFEPSTWPLAPGTAACTSLLPLLSLFLKFLPAAPPLNRCSKHLVVMDAGTHMLHHSAGQALKCNILRISLHLAPSLPDHNPRPSQRPFKLCLTSPCLLCCAHRTMRSAHNNAYVHYRPLLGRMTSSKTRGHSQRGKRNCSLRNLPAMLQQAGAM